MTIAAETTPKLLTAEEVQDLPGRWELVRGEIREMAPPGGEHGVRTMRMRLRLGVFVENHDLGTVFAETGFLITQDPDTVRAPDVAFVSKSRSPDQWPSGWVTIIPDLVVETISPNDTVGEVEDKIAEWLVAGVQQVWAVYPRPRTVHVHRPGHPVRVLTEADTLEGGEVVPGFSLSVRAIFD